MGLIRPDIPVSVSYCPRTETTSVAVPPEAFDEFTGMEKGELILPLGGPMPSSSVVSRFVAKVALEFMAARLVSSPEGLAYLCDEAQLDGIREHARLGRNEDWPVHIRQIYAANGMVFGFGGKPEQIVHESDFLVTSQSEWYFVLVIFGMEFTINLGGPDVDGYLSWLDTNNGVSPLYSGKNGTRYTMPC